MADELSPALTRQVLIALRRIMRASDLHSRHLLRRFGVTGPQLLVLTEVGARGQVASSDLARAVSLSLPTATDIAIRLEARGLVERQRSESDRRQVVVSLTEAGQAVLDAAPPPLQEAFTRRLRDLEAWEQTQILSVLQRIVTMMAADEIPADPILTPSILGQTPGAASAGQTKPKEIL